MKQISENTSLKNYLYINNIMLRDASEKMGYNPCYMSRLINGRCPYGKKIAVLIEKFTDGKIKADDIVGKYEDNSVVARYES